MSVKEEKGFTLADKACVGLFALLVISLTITYFIRKHIATTHQNNAQITLGQLYTLSTNYGINLTNLSSESIETSDNLRYSFKVRITDKGWQFIATADSANWPIRDQWVIDQDSSLYQNEEYVSPYDK